ncbi:hypothetical protein [Planococcus lenghuensis]|uniref:hypothetical protein n=1 Tax=Planococcus lenghuensis TaxID=2213202 RepID=UPI0012EBEE19|nr:hypothetical protein [Planococcus lenghuensis]
MEKELGKTVLQLVEKVKGKYTYRESDPADPWHVLVPPIIGGLAEGTVTVEKEAIIQL